ncbi:MAG: dienelactone hydrolase family protein [Amaricoccus sp.]|uniref:dienelactone hydrolase family protein n=1 Tax=Amaricoccus sp. TaxID=1872485 RepID=UPI0033149355
MTMLDLQKYPLSLSPERTDGLRYPAVVILHGNFGLGPPFGGLLKGVGDRLAEHGYVTAVPRYYPDDEPHVTDADPQPHVPTVAAAIEAIGQRDDVDPSRLGIVGYSLGAAIAMSLIASKPQGWASVFVDFYGPLPASIGTGVVKFPPTAIFHNRRDLPVPFEANSVALLGMLPKTLDVRFSAFTEDNPPFHHVFDPAKTPHESSLADTEDWLLRHLPPEGK